MLHFMTLTNMSEIFRNYCKRQKTITLKKSIFFLHISKGIYFRNVAWKFHKKSPKIGSARTDRVNQLSARLDGSCAMLHG